MSKDYKHYQEGLVRSILTRPEEIANVVNIVELEDFSDVNLKMVYESALEIFLEKGNLSLPNIALKIGEKGGAIDTAWLFSLNTNMAKWIEMAPPEVWAKLLKQESAKFKAKKVLTSALKDIEDKEKNHLDVMDRASEELSKVSVDAITTEKFNINKALDRFESETKEILETGGKVTTINSAYPTIDYYTRGWGATHLITIGARTGIGKSVFAINNIVAALAQNKSVLFFSLEMTEREVFSRMIAQLSMIPIQKIEKASPLTPEEIQRQVEALETIRNSKLNIDTSPKITAEYIKRAAIQQAQSEEGLDFIVIDYLQLISNSGIKNRQEAVADVSRNMKILAKELNVPVMVLVQLNRERRDGTEEDNTPKIYDIRESAAIAQDSNVVILIDRKMDQDGEMIDPKATFIIAKNRQGESNKYIPVRARLESSLFIDDNLKGQELIRNIEMSMDCQETQDSREDFNPNNFNPSSYENDDFEAMNSYDSFSTPDDDEFSNLFNDEDFDSEDFF